MTQRELHIDGLANARDLGGLERRDGSVTPEGVFLRAEQLDSVTPEGWDALRALGIRTVIDLRRPDERSRAVPADMDALTIDLDGDERDFWEPIEAAGLWGTPLYYGPHLDELPHRMAAVLDAIAAAGPGGVLFHCGAGWDRTGFVAAMLLRALEVTSDAAASDYLTSFETADAATALHGRSCEVEARHAVAGRHGHTPDSAFRAAYDGIDLDAWFAHAGVAPDTRAAVRTWRGAVPATSGGDVGGMF